MTARWRTVAVYAAALLGSAVVMGQSPSPGYKVPRTPWGDPDLQGIWTNIAEGQTPLERPAAMGTRAVLTDAEWQARVDGAKKQSGDLALRGVDVDVPSRQASRIIDPPNGRFPPLTPDGQRRQAALKAADARMAGPEDAPLFTRCITRGVLSMVPTLSNMYYEIVQSPGWVTILYEHVRVARLIPLDGRPHLEDGIRSWMGDPRGRWEGGTLVVETTNFRDGTLDAGFVASDALRVIERFTRTSAGEIAWQATVIDPKTYTAPITVALPLHNRPVPDQILEYACHEGNERNLELKLSIARFRERTKP